MPEGNVDHSRVERKGFRRWLGYSIEDMSTMESNLYQMIVGHTKSDIRHKCIITGEENVLEEYRAMHLSI